MVEEAVVTGAAIWEKMLADPKFQSQPEQLREVFRPFVEAVPVVLKEDLEKVVSNANIGRARAKFLRYCLDNGYMKEMIVAASEGKAGWFAKWLGSFVATRLMRIVIKGIEKSADESERNLQSNVWFDPKMDEWHVVGELTIGKLLLLAPQVILRVVDDKDDK